MKKATRFLIGIKMIEIFDSATHPTIDNTWLNPRFSEYCDIKLLLNDMKKYKIKKAFAIGLTNVGGYELEKYIEFIKPHKNLIPIAFCEVGYDYKKLEEIKTMGYKGIKIHPRLSKVEPDDDRIFELIKYANKLNLIVLYCGFLGVSEKFVQKIEDEKLLFLHTGGKNLEKTFEKLKNKKNILLDLSYTFNKYEEVNDYIAYLFENYSNRICIGSDHPEVKIKDLRVKFDLFTNFLDNKKVERIAFRNLDSIINMQMTNMEKRVK